MRQLGILSLIVCLAAASGCNICCWGKRATELTGPTDIRRSHYWCLGEDALFAQPMGPSREDYGLKPTCWREWPADSARCVDDSCDRAMKPNDQFDGNAPMLEWEQSVPSEVEPRDNPFRDDATLLPAPPGAGVHLPGPSLDGRRPIAGPVTSENMTRVNTLPSGSATDGVAPIVMNSAMNFSQQPTETPRAQPARSLPEPPRKIPSTTQPPLQITVSEPIDTPVKFLTPLDSSRGTAHQAVATSELLATHEVTLASLERMIETSPTNAPASSSGAQVIQNDFAPAPHPFRLATRTSLEAAENDAALESKTLSALQSLISLDAAPAASR